MSTKDYFDKKEPIIRIAASSSLSELGNEVESVGYIEEKIKDKDRFIPYVDFSKPENFVRFGSAEEYYGESIKRIYRTYPYDGSLKEKTQWHNSSSFLDQYIFDKVYPRTTGYANFSPNGWGVNASAGALVNGIGLSNLVEYIQFFGGPNPDPDNTSIKDIFPSATGKANIYDSDKTRESNLKLDFDEGVTIEFWLKKGDMVSALTGAAESIFDVWNGIDTAAGYGRLLIYLRQSTGILRCRVVSGSNDSAAIDLDSTAVTDNKWHHHAVTFKNTDDDGFEINYYKDGALTFVPSLPSANKVNEITGSLIANIGAFRRPSTSRSTTAALSSPQKIDGYGKLSGSIDEFRFWKTARSGKEIGRNWFTQVYGGTNTDDSNTKLGVYYKFNEGITLTSSYDSIVLDYSGRLTSGSWEGYTSASRNTGSAIISASAASYEFEDPILYSFHTNVTSTLNNYVSLGKNYDYKNNASIYNSIPEWIISEDRYVGSNLLKLTQIMASYFDTLAYQIKALPSIKNTSYTPFTSSFNSITSGPTGSAPYKPLPFANRLLESAGLATPEIFVDADVISKLNSRDEKILFKENLYDTKNLIYQNLYNNLTYIYKSKGTEKAFRNAIRCYGVDDELIKINVYANNITYELKDSYNYTIQKKNFIDFHIPDHNTAVVYQATSSNSNTVSFISGSEEFLSGSARTLEAEILFPHRETIEKPGEYIIAPGLTASLFGTKAASSSAGSAQSAQNDAGYTTWIRASQATLADIITLAGFDDNDKFTVNVPSAMGGAGTNITIKMVSGTPSTATANQVEVSTAGTSGAILARLVIAINGGTPSPSNSVAFGSGAGDSDDGVAGISAALGTNPTITITATNAGFAGNSITFTDVEGTMVAGGSNGSSPATLAAGVDGDMGDLRVMAIKDTNDILSTNVYIKATSSALQLNLTSSVFYDVYENEKWNLAVRLRPSTYPMGDRVSGSINALYHGSGTIEFCGVNSSNNTIRNEFYLTTSVGGPGALDQWLGSPKRVFCGATRTNFTGALEVYSDVKISSVRYWFDYLPDEAIKAHARDPGNAGVIHPYQHAYLFNSNYNNSYVPKIETLALNWDFDRVTGSDGSGEFVVQDISSGSTALTGRYGPVGKILNAQHTGIGYGFKTNSTKVVDKNYLPAARQRLPESVASSDMIEIRNRDDINFTRETRPITHFIAVEKSMYQTVSEEMMKMFATIKDFNSLIGDPVNRYRHSYKRMEKLRQLFFESVDNVTDLDRYVDFYKWLDSSIDKIIEQFFPISSDASDSIRNMVESHVLERNKYTSKFPTFEMKHDPPTGQILAINELLYPWKQGHAPLPDNAATATFTFTDKANEQTTITLTDVAGTSVTFEVDNDGNGAAGSNTAMDPPTNNAAGMASILISSVNASALQITATTGGGATGEVLLTQDVKGEGGNTAITLSNYSNWDFNTTATFPTRFTGGTMPEAENCLWWKDRLGRDGQTHLGSTSDAGLNSSKEQIRIIATTVVSSSGPTYRSNPYVYRKLTKPYKFSAKVDVELHGGINFAPSKRLDFYKSLLTPGSDNYIHIKSSDFVNPACSDLLDLDKKTRQAFNVYLPYDEQNKGEIYAPFSLFSSSFTTGSVTAISGVGGPTNIHVDAYGTCKETPMQGPFTEKYVGGMPHRHVFFTTTGAFGTASPSRREEAWSVVLPAYSEIGYATELKLVPVDHVVQAVADLNAPGWSAARSWIARDGYAKRPVNIKNIQQTIGHTTTGSTVIGNYTKNYEVVQTSGRYINPRYFAETKGVISASVASTLVSGVYDFALPDRGRHASVFVEKFSAPGGPEVMSRGFLDVVAEEFSVYNSLNNRNLSVRQPLQTLLTRHAGASGYDSSLKEPSASYHKVHRNRRDRIVFSSSGHIVGDGSQWGPETPIGKLAGTASSYDNWYVTRMIPRSDVQYSWITASVLYITGAVNKAAVRGSSRENEPSASGVSILGYQKPAYMRSGSTEHNAYNAWNASTDIVFVSASDYGSFTLDSSELAYWGITHFHNATLAAAGGFLPTDFVGMNHHIVEPISSSENTLGYPPQNMPGTIGNPSDYDDDPVYYFNMYNVDNLSAPGKYITYEYDEQRGAQGTSDADDTTIGATAPKGLNALLLNRNGPYHYPSWKQIRTGEHPVARYHKKKNILDFSIGPVASLRRPATVAEIALVLKTGAQTELRYGTAGFTDNIVQELQRAGAKSPVRKETITPVTNKYKPVEHTLFDTTADNAEQQRTILLEGGKPNNVFTLRHTLGNNMNYFPIGQGELDQKLGIINDPDNVIYDEITSEINTLAQTGYILENQQKSFDLLNLSYREVVFPKEENAYLGKIRGRQHYTESSGLTHQGYDRVDYRTFWRTRPEHRLRTDALALNSMGNTIRESMWNDDTTGYIFKYGQIDRNKGIGPSEHDFQNGLEMLPPCLSMWPLDASAESGTLCGELFSNPYASMTASDAIVANTLKTDSVHYSLRSVPTASQTYLFQNKYMSMTPIANFETFIPPKYLHIIKDDGWDADQGISGAHFKPHYSASLLSGKSPFYDSYDQWAVDVRTMGQGYSILPEFKISDHMDYYIDNGFAATNKKFLSLVGALHTASSDTPISTGNLPFYKLYSHSDFMKFVELIGNDYQKDVKGRAKEFTLKCKAVKKLLPYNGFYPVLRCVQLGSMFSQSYGPHLTSSIAFAGKTPQVHPQEQLQSLLQPWFAPGIMYNTIKSGIAVDWPHWTGSLPNAVGIAGIGYLTQTGSDTAGTEGLEYEKVHNIRFPFESLIEPHTYLPVSNSGDPGVGSEIPLIHPPGLAGDLTDLNQGKHAIWTGDYTPNYSMAMHNFLGEIPRFFLDKGKFQSFTSTPGRFQMLSGTTYFMDVTLRKSGKKYSMSGSAVDKPPGHNPYEDMIMFEGPDFPFKAGRSSGELAFNKQDMQSGSARGIHYGPTCQTHNYPLDPLTSLVYVAAQTQDPAFAPYTPPYFYGKSVARLAFSPHKHRLLLSAVDLHSSHGEIGEFTIEEIIAGAQIETTYDPNWRESWNLLKDYGSGSFQIGEDNQGNESLAYKSKMRVASSINLFGKTTVPEITYNPITGQPTEAKASQNDESLDAWVISPKFETPILNFSGNIDTNLGYSTRGMWYGYGVEPTGSQGIYMGLRESHPTAILKAMLGGAGENAVHGVGTQPDGETRLGHRQTGSLYQVLGFKEPSGLVGPDRKLGQIADNKIISEAVVAIPIKSNYNSGDTPFFPISRARVDWAWILQDHGQAVADLHLQQQGVSEPPSKAIFDMVKKMKNYYLPPHMDFVKNRGIDPFAMFIFEFHHCLDKQDLIDVWQNLMPKIAMEAQKDEASITLDLAASWDFLNLNTMPKDVRWMVFKVKKRAEQSYFNVTEDTKDDKKFKFQFGDEKLKKPDYNYNWPYDFFSLVELVQVEGEYKLRGATGDDVANTSFGADNMSLPWLPPLPPPKPPADSGQLPETEI